MGDETVALASCERRPSTAHSLCTFAMKEPAALTEALNKCMPVNEGP